MKNIRPLKNLFALLALGNFSFIKNQIILAKIINYFIDQSGRKNLSTKVSQALRI